MNCNLRQRQRKKITANFLITNWTTPEAVVSTTTTASSATAIRYTMTSATLIASSSPGNGISGQELNTKGSTLTAPITACQTTSRLSTLYWRWNTWCTIMPARVS